MKQTTIKFDKKTPEPVTIQRLQKVVDLISKTKKGTESIQGVGLSSNFVGFLTKAKIISKISKDNYEVIEPVVTRKLYYRVMNIQTKYNEKRKENRKIISFYEQKKDSRFIDVPDTDMLGLVNMPSTEPIKLQRTPKPRVKKAVALPWWKRILLYLANH
jgi:hypothetical protein